MSVLLWVLYILRALFFLMVFFTSFALVIGLLFEHVTWLYPANIIMYSLLIVIVNFEIKKAEEKQ